VCVWHGILLISRSRGWRPDHPEFLQREFAAPVISLRQRICC